MKYSIRKKGAGTHAESRPISSRGGFSLLEILVAMAVLTFIVLMMSMVFQQSADIWNSATQRVGLDMAGRGIIAQIQEDMAMAVPASNYTNAQSREIRHEFLVSKAQFITLRDTGKGRLVHRVIYSFENKIVYREETPLEFQNNRWIFGPSSAADKVALNGTDMGGIAGFRFLPEWHEDVRGNPTAQFYEFPERVNIEMSIQYTSKYGSFRARSLGPNQKDDSRKKKSDDIVVGGEWQ